MIYTFEFSPNEYNKKEILRYCGVKSADDNLNKLIDKCIKEANPYFTYKVCYGEFPIKIKDNQIDLPMLSLHSKDLAKNLGGCDSLILFAATVGIGIDRLIGKYSRIKPAKAVAFQAIGAERIEMLCDLFCDSIIRNQGKSLCPRFSPGYGDLPLDFQKEFFKILDCQKKIGLTLNESLLMSPSKSVTAIIGIKN